MKSSIIVEEKLKKVVEILFVKETLGINLYENISNYPELLPLVDELRRESYKLEYYALKGENEYYDQADKVREVIHGIEALMDSEPDYKKSKILKEIL